MQHRQQLLCLFLFLLCLCRQDHTYKQQLVTMLQYAILQVPVFLTELLVVINIESNSRHSWTAIFTPLYILSFLSIAACILSCCIKVFTVEVEMKLNIIPYSRVIKRISHISAYSLISAYVFAATNIHC